MTFDYERLLIYCDEQQDLDLMIQLSAASPELSKIPAKNYRILPKSSKEIKSQLPRSAAMVVTEERPDYCFIYKNIPSLIIELTEHGYTGDNPLQRFTRCAGAAENNIPYIYMTPFSRVRDDEMDQIGGGSKRNVNTDVFKGMSILSDTFNIPQLAINWPIASTGKPKKIPRSSTISEVRAVFGELISAIEVLIFQLGEDIIRGIDVRNNAFLISENAKLKSLYATSNRRDPGTRYYVDRSGLEKLVGHPKAVFDNITKLDYFYKDKPERLIAYLCIEKARIDCVVTPSGKIVKGEIAQKLIQSIITYSYFNKNLVYYTGYKWRSDPHSGVAVNTDYIFCRKASGKTTKDREASLVLVYPRVYLQYNSLSKAEIDSSLSELSSDCGDLYDLFMDRYPACDLEDKKNNLLRSKDHVGVWSNGTKQARVFKRYCDLIILGDAIIVGENWREESEIILKELGIE